MLLNIFYICIPYFRAIDIQTLVGNIGGYIGLFLGYSFLQIPDFVAWIIQTSKRYYWSKCKWRQNNKCLDVHTKKNKTNKESQDTLNRTNNDNRCPRAISRVEFDNLAKRISKLENKTH